MTSEYPDLTRYKVLSFDCYGTLIDWELGFLTALTRYTSQLPPSHPYNETPPTKAMQTLDNLLNELQQSQPTVPASQHLSSALQTFVTEHLGPLPVPSAEELDSFAQGPGTWPPFPDTIPALLSLSRRYRLVILSNIDEGNMSGSVGTQMGVVPFSGAYTAERIGSFKPDHGNFRYLFDKVRGLLLLDDKGENNNSSSSSSSSGGGGGDPRARAEVPLPGTLLHVARSLKVDHVPAKELGLPSVWISRGGEKKEGYGVGGDYEELRGEGKLGFGWRFDTVGDFAEEVERQFREKARKGKGRSE